jgi:hypothetical protein
VTTALISPEAVARIISHTGLPFALEGEQRQTWVADVVAVAALALRAAETRGPAPAVLRDRWGAAVRRLVLASEALRPFEDAPPALPPGFLAGAATWMAGPRGPGRRVPAALPRLVAERLVAAFHGGFARRPSASVEGPLARFAGAVFAEVARVNPAYSAPTAEAQRHRLRAAVARWREGAENRAHVASAGASRPSAAWAHERAALSAENPP